MFGALMNKKVKILSFLWSLCIFVNILRGISIIAPDAFSTDSELSHFHTDILDISSDINVTKHSLNITSNTRFLIYNPIETEGFNACRGTYLRAAHIVKHMITKGEDWVLVLPPWNNLVKHWRSTYIDQDDLQWSLFFDLKEMNSYVPVMEYKDFLQSMEHDDPIFHAEFVNKKPIKMYNKEICNERHLKFYKRNNTDGSEGQHWSTKMLKERKLICIEIEAPSSLNIFGKVLEMIKTRYVYLPVIHFGINTWLGSKQAYKVRRSMVYASHLRKEADLFREKFLNSTDVKDKTLYDPNDRRFSKLGTAIGGPFIGIHLRRGDYHIFRKTFIPTLEEVAAKINEALEKYELNLVYLSTDANTEEIENLRKHVKGKIIQYPRPENVIRKFKDGGISIIDQWIAAHARYFIGTCYSRFSRRIDEDRDILGFSLSTCHKCICGKQAKSGECVQPSISPWRQN